MKKTQVAIKENFKRLNLSKKLLQNKSGLLSIGYIIFGECN